MYKVLNMRGKIALGVFFNKKSFEYARKKHTWSDYLFSTKIARGVFFNKKCPLDFILMPTPAQVSGQITCGHFS
jgi:hypothetical protein